MDFGWSAEQRELRDVVDRFAGRELGGVPGDAAEFPAKLWKRCAAAGIQGLALPEPYGGSAADARTTALAMETLGRHCRDYGLLFSLGAQMWAVQHPIARFGTEEQKRRYLPSLCDGSLVGAHAMTEPGSGSDAFGLTSTAGRTEDGWVLDGTKSFVTNAPVASLFLVFATTDRARGATAISAFLVPRNTPGLTVGRPVAKMGLATSPMADVALSGCRVGNDAMLGRPGHGLAIFLSAMAWERTLILAPALGTMQRQLDQCVDFARQRRQFGRPIASFQAVSHRIVEMRQRLESARLALYRAAWALDTGDRSTADGALAKLAVSEAFVASSLDAIQVHGGAGYLVDVGLERTLRDAVAGRIYSGTSELLMNMIANKMGL
ncbi:acyl-CoA dehydrogenase family protein [Dactylosporangium sp. NPDC051485]|uniref:acyl-CoA dehydrogenase family protein n=1 Tax=Dactylosporangium sp. NPDC051485 TaxID=3154846 RepID=UPI00341AE0F0